MIPRIFNFFALFFFLLMFSGCELIEDVFEFGVWFALFLIVAVIVILVLIFNSVGYAPRKGQNITGRAADSE